MDMAKLLRKGCKPKAKGGGPAATPRLGKAASTAQSPSDGAVLVKDSRGLNRLQQSETIVCS